MSQVAILGIAMLLFLISLPLISIGTTTGAGWLWVLGLILLVIGGLIPPVLRYLPIGESEE